MITRRTITLFWSHVDRQGPIPAHCRRLGRCWVWMASKDRQGYGMFGMGKKTVKAHRFAFFLKHGEWPEPCGLHECDRSPGSRDPSRWRCRRALSEPSQTVRDQPSAHRQDCSPAMLASLAVILWQAEDRPEIWETQGAGVDVTDDCSYEGAFGDKAAWRAIKSKQLACSMPGIPAKGARVLPALTLAMTFHIFSPSQVPNDGCSIRTQAS